MLDVFGENIEVQILVLLQKVLHDFSQVFSSLVAFLEELQVVEGRVLDFVGLLRKLVQD